MGLPKTAAQMMGEILQNTVYKLKTCHGISDRTYFSTTLRRILGSGQGSGASPCIWTLVLDPILLSVSKKYKCLEIITPTKQHINRLGDAFVDDTTLFLILTQFDDEKIITPEYIAKKLQEIAQDLKKKTPFNWRKPLSTKMFLVPNTLEMGQNRKRKHSNKNRSSCRHQTYQRILH
jgi:hypothetical protein